MRTVAIVAFAFLGATSWSTENRLILFNQSDFGAKKGFYLSLENSAPGTESCKLGTLRLIFGVADGSSWHFLTKTLPWRIGQRVRAEGRWRNGVAALMVDGQELVAEQAGLRVVDQPLVAGEHPSWASGEAEYVLAQTAAKVQSEGSTALVFSFPAAKNPLLSVFESPLAQTARFKLNPDQSLLVEGEFEIQAKNTGIVAGAIDEFGQVAAASFPGKVLKVEDLLSAHRREQVELSKWKPDPALDAYGGDQKAGWHSKATGFYSVEKRGSIWWMISPKGNPLFYTGMCTSPAIDWDMTPVSGRENLFAALPPKIGSTAPLWGKDKWGQADGDYVCLHGWNLVRVFGDGWQKKAADQCAQRLRAWGFTGQAKWSNPVGKMPYCPVLGIDAPRTSRHFDVFDPEVRSAIKTSLAKQIVPKKNDPWVVGWSIGNEFDECITTDEVKELLAQPESKPVKKAILSFMARSQITKPEGEDLEKIRHFVAKAYYECLYHTVKELDPNHLYFGYWIVPGWWQNDSDWSLIAPYCDVIGYDRYAPSYSGVENLLKAFDKPTFLGEYSYPAWYGGERGFGRYGTFVTSDEESGASYARLIRDASRDPACVGTCWFQYRDEPISGRGPGHGPNWVMGEHYAFGFVDGTNRPKEALVRAATTANRKATHYRLSLK